MFTTIKKNNFLSANFILNFSLETMNEANMKNGINIAICLPKKIIGYLR